MKTVFFSLLILAGFAFPASAHDTAAHSPADFDEAAWQAEWNAADKDGDGKLSREEVTAANPSAAETFNETDTNGDGYISPEEDKAALAHSHHEH